MGWTITDNQRLKSVLDNLKKSWSYPIPDGATHVIEMFTGKYVRHNPGSGVYWFVFQVSHVQPDGEKVKKQKFRLNKGYVKSKYKSQEKIETVLA